MEALPVTTNNFLLSDLEKNTVVNTEFFYVKHTIIEKVYLLLGLLSKQYDGLLAGGRGLTTEITQVSPKIYRGENYRQLPYVMLDQPRYYKQKNAFAIRSLFWWGQHLSIHLVLGGIYAEKYRPKIMEAMKKELLPDWYFAQTSDPWHHHFEEGNYRPVKEINEPEANPEDHPGYIKLGRKLSLDNWEQSQDFFVSSFSTLLSLLEEKD